MTRSILQYLSFDHRPGRLLATGALSVVVLLCCSSSAMAADIIPCPTDGGARLLSITDSMAEWSFGEPWTATGTCGESGGNDGEGGSCDDGSYLYPGDDVDSLFGTIFPDGLPFVGGDVLEFFVNHNGNLSFGGPIPTYTPQAIPGLERPSIAVFFADVDLTNGDDGTTNPGEMWICEDPDNDRIMFTWEGVGFYDSRFDVTNTFQLIVSNPGDICVIEEEGVRGLDVEFRYQQLTWYVGEASDGDPNGLCDESPAPDSCSPAVAGFDGGDDETYYQLEGSLTNDVNDAFLSGSNLTPFEAGAYRFRIVDGSAVPTCGNGQLEVCEDCDDGDANGTTSSCCSSDCTFVPNGNPCRDTGVECHFDDTCDGGGVCLDGGLADEGSACGDSSDTDCNAPDTCSAQGDCLENHAEVATPCGSGADNECTDPDTCDEAGVCVSNHMDAGTACGDSSDTDCTDPDSCNGDGSCDGNHELDGTTCADNELFCDGAESCSSGECVSAGSPCDETIEHCDEEENVCYDACGDGIVDSPYETCDDGNSDSGDGCFNCIVEAGWICDDSDPSVCEPEFTCGDGIVRDGEACDDGNSDSGDGCFNCVVEDGWICDDGDPSVCEPESTCGDGTVDTDEACDDGNDNSGDGCFGCDIESGWICDDGDPTSCHPDSDGDGVPDSVDNCPDTPNTDQADLDGDGLGDVCDDDLDGGGVPDIDELVEGTDPNDPSDDYKSYDYTGGGVATACSQAPSDGASPLSAVLMIVMGLIVGARRRRVSSRLLGPLVKRGDSTAPLHTRSPRAL